MVFEALQHTFKWKMNFCTFKAYEFAKDFMIPVEALIKPPCYQKILN